MAAKETKEWNRVKEEYGTASGGIGGSSADTVSGTDTNGYVAKNSLFRLAAENVAGQESTYAHSMDIQEKYGNL
jgi:hypothetical protein